jgi:hypothetical protein
MPGTPPLAISRAEGRPLVQRGAIGGPGPERPRTAGGHFARCGQFYCSAYWLSSHGLSRLPSAFSKIRM